MTELRIADDLLLPLDTVTDTIGILAVKGAGKTYTFLVLAEEMIKAGLPVVIIDVVGVCWGLRASADGTGAGLPVVILGGSHGDLAISSTSGKAVADLIASERFACVLDLSGFETKAETIRFVLDFITRLYQVNREPLHVILDEADDVAPQKPFGEETRMLRAVEVLVRRGRARGLGVTLATQRAAVLNKNVLTQIGTLVVGRTIAPTDRKAIEAWVEAHGTIEQRDELLGSLASLPTGTVWVWTPLRGIFQKVQIRPRETFDSSATPKVGQVLPAPRMLADIDLSVIRERLVPAEVQEHADSAGGAGAAAVRGLKRRIDELERENADLRARPPITVTALSDDDWRRLEALADAYRSTSAEASALGDLLFRTLHNLNLAPSLGEGLRLVTGDFPKLPEGSRSSASDEAPKEAPRRHRAIVEPETRPSAPARTRHRRNPESTRSGPVVLTPTDLNRPQIRILEALASFRGLGSGIVARGNVAVFSDQSPRSSSFGNNLGALRTRGMIEYPASGSVRITEAGLACVDEPQSVTSLADLHAAWLAKLPRPQGMILRVLLAAYPRSWDRDGLAAQAGQSPTSSSYGNNVGALRGLGLVDYPQRGQVVATALLFPEGL